jgi:hypothetical protein
MTALLDRRMLRGASYSPPPSVQRPLPAFTFVLIFTVVSYCP